MKIVKNLLAATALVASISASASAQVTWSTTVPTPLTALDLTGSGACGTCGLGSGIAVIRGGSVLNADQTTADIQGFTFAGGLLGTTKNFLAAGQSPTQPSTMTFLTGIDFVSFLWGSPDLYNRLTVRTSNGVSQTFVAGPLVAPSGTISLNLGNQSGSQAFSQYVSFESAPGNLIYSLEFTNSPLENNSFEAANFNVRRVPEPSNVALMAAGLAALGLVARRRKVS